MAMFRGDNGLPILPQDPTMDWSGEGDPAGDHMAKAMAEPALMLEAKDWDYGA